MTVRLYEEDAYLRSCEAQVVASGPDWVELDRTVFYARGGGQPGDTGWLEDGDRRYRVVDTHKSEDGSGIVHVLEGGAAGLEPGRTVTARIDWERRHRLMRVHTLLHLLCAVVNAPVTGGSVREGSGRLDFDIPDPVLDREALTAALNRLVEQDVAVAPRWITDEELAARPELVRTMSVSPPVGQGRVRLLEIEGVDLQPCGGTHVQRTGEIGPVAVAKIEKKGRQNRRITVRLED